MAKRLGALQHGRKSNAGAPDVESGVEETAFTKLFVIVSHAEGEGAAVGQSEIDNRKLTWFGMATSLAARSFLNQSKTGRAL